MLLVAPVVRTCTTFVFDESIVNVLEETPDQTTIMRLTAGGITVILLVSATRRIRESGLVSSVTEECDITSVCKDGILMLDIRLQLLMSNVVNELNIDGIEDIFVDATLSVKSPVLYVVGICEMFVQLLTSNVSRLLNFVPGGKRDRFVILDLTDKILDKVDSYVMSSVLDKPFSAGFVLKSMIVTSSPIISTPVVEFWNNNKLYCRYCKC